MPEYLKVDGHDLYCYEWDNDGEAVVLLHGGLSQTAQAGLRRLVPALEEDLPRLCIRSDMRMALPPTAPESMQFRVSGP
jgi:hypothetical protein